MSGTFQDKLNKLKELRLLQLSRGNLDLRLEREYWHTRAEAAARSLTELTDSDLIRSAIGQLSICQETEDEVNRAIAAKEAEAKAGKGNNIPEVHDSSV